MLNHIQLRSGCLYNGYESTPDLHLCPSDDGRLAVVFRVHRRCSSTDVVAVVAERASRRSAEHRSRISWLAACRLMDGVTARNFSRAIWHCAASVLSPQHVSLTYKTHDEHKYTRYNIYLIHRELDKCPRRHSRSVHVQGDYYDSRTSFYFFFLRAACSFNFTLLSRIIFCT